MIKDITFIGSGNIASELAVKLHKSKIRIKQIYSRNKITGQKLADLVKSVFVQNIREIINVDLIIICVNDDNIKKVVAQLGDIPIVHTSGITGINIFKNKRKHGVIYPLQSINNNITVDFNDIPICIEANCKNLEKDITTLMSRISSNIIVMDSKKRKKLHLAAVIASNFSNYCYIIAKSILEEEKLDFNLLHPLIQHTAQKNLNSDPVSNQTGPAKRKDQKTIKEHLNLLSNKNHKKIYKLLSKSIMKQYEK